MGLYRVYAIIVSCATRLYQGVRVNAVSSNSAELRGSATAIAWLPSSNTIPTDLCIAIAAACEREKEREKGRERERTSASRKSEKRTKAVATDCESIRSLENGELYWRLLGLIVFFGNTFILRLLIAPRNTN